MERYGFRTSLLHHDAYISLPGTRVDVDGKDAAVHHAFDVNFRRVPGIRAQLVYVGRGYGEAILPPPMSLGKSFLSTA